MNVENVLRKPLKVFDNKSVMKTIIYSCLIIFLTLTISNIYSLVLQVKGLTPNIYPIEEHDYSSIKTYFNLIKYSVYELLYILTYGYIIGKYKFCHWSILSYYGTVYMKIIWFINKFIYHIDGFLSHLNSAIIITVAIMIIIYFTKDKAKII